MKASKKTNIIIITISIVVLLIIGICLIFRISSVPTKEKRLQEKLAFEGTQELSNIDVAFEIKSALEKHANWNNLFLSDNFKKKYQNRKYIIDDIRNVDEIWSGPDKLENDTIVVMVNKKDKLFDNDESDNISTVYRFRYVLDKNGEIDDLILIDKEDVYTINGEPVK